MVLACQLIERESHARGKKAAGVFLDVWCICIDSTSKVLSRYVGLEAVGS